MNNLIAKLKEELLKAARNEIRVSYEKPDKPLKTAASKIGGNPDLPADFEYPEYTGEGYKGDTKCRPLSFMAQINLKDIADKDTENLLPKSGVLSFFYENISQEWGFSPEHKGCARVYYFPDESLLKNCELPENLEEEAVIPEFKISFEKSISLPSSDDFPCSFDGAEDDNDFYDTYIDVCSELGYDYDDWGDRTKLLGYPDLIQNPMEEECEKVTRGYGAGSPEDNAAIPEAEKEDIKSKASEWTLLFQMGTVEDEKFTLMFGDCGHIYFWIKKSDLEKQNFDNIWLILQCG